MILYDSHQERRTDTDYNINKPRIRTERINIQYERRKIKMGQRKRETQKERLWDNHHPREINGESQDAKPTRQLDRWSGQTSPFKH